MKSIREYLDLIKENEQPDWKTVVLSEIKKHGMPKKAYCYQRYQADMPFSLKYDNNKEAYVWFEDLGIGEWEVDYDLNDDLSPEEFLLKAIQTFCENSEDTESYGTFQGKVRDKGGVYGAIYDETGYINELDEELIDDICQSAGCDNIYELYLRADDLPLGRAVSIDYDDNAREMIVDDNGGTTHLEWPGLVIQLNGNPIKISGRGKSYDPSGDKFEPEKNTTTKNKRPRPTNNTDDQTSEIQP
jgi:hypothetical protein